MKTDVPSSGGWLSRTHQGLALSGHIQREILRYFVLTAVCRCDRSVVITDNAVFRIEVYFEGSVLHQEITI